MVNLRKIHFLQVKTVIAATHNTLSARIWFIEKTIYEVQLAIEQCCGIGSENPNYSSANTFVCIRYFWQFPLSGCRHRQNLSDFVTLFQFFDTIGNGGKMLSF